MIPQANIAPGPDNSKAIAGIGLLSTFFLGFIGPLVLFFASKDRFIRFHSAQYLIHLAATAVLVAVCTALGFGLTMLVRNAIASLVGLVFVLVAACLSLRFFLHSLFQVYYAFTGKAPKFRWVGDYAEKWA